MTDQEKQANREKWNAGIAALKAQIVALKTQVKEAKKKRDADEVAPG